MRRKRTQSDRDAVTVEMMYAAVTGAGLAALGFLALATPVMLGQAHGEARKGWFTAAVIVAAALFCGRVALTLRRFERRNRLAELEQEAGGPGRLDGAGGRAGTGGPGRPVEAGGGQRVPGDQPSQPGRTSPDS